MVFSSVPLYLDPPNWNHEHQIQLQGSGGNDQFNQHHLLPPPMAAQLPAMGGGGGGSEAPKPNSMSERARLAKMPAPEVPLKCPRCDSSNTKFCYFNNYSLTQPRHFCKSCRRYWTRGGALRNVPVGGGFRRNKRSSSSSASKSSSGTTTNSGGVAATSAASKPSSSLSSSGDFMSSGGFVFPPSGGGSMTSFMASLQNMAHLGLGNLGLTSYGGTLNGIGGLGSSQLETFNGIHHHGLFNHNNNNNNNQIVTSPSSFLSGFEPPRLYSNHHQDVIGEEIQHTSKNNIINSSSMVIPSHESQFASVKTEYNGQAGLNLSKELMGISSSNDNNNQSQFWGPNMGNVTNMWTDLSCPNSSSTTNLP